MKVQIKLGKYSLWGFLLKRGPGNWGETVWTICFGPVPGILILVSWIRKDWAPIKDAMQAAHNDPNCSWTWKGDEREE